MVAKKRPTQERHAVYFRPRKWRGNWVLEQAVSSLDQVDGIARRIETRYPKGEHAVFVIAPHDAAPEHFADGREPGRLFRQSTCEYATFLRQQLQARVAE